MSAFCSTPQRSHLYVLPRPIQSHSLKNGGLRPFPLEYPLQLMRSIFGVVFQRAWANRDRPTNAWQWCADWRVNDYYAKSPVDDPTGPDSKPTQVFNDGTVWRGGRVLRGGSWYDTPYRSRSATRWGSLPSCRDCYVGIRIARAL